MNFAKKSTNQLITSLLFIALCSSQVIPLMADKDDGKITINWALITVASGFLYYYGESLRGVAWDATKHVTKKTWNNTYAPEYTVEDAKKNEYPSIIAGFTTNNPNLLKIGLSIQMMNIINTTYGTNSLGLWAISRGNADIANHIIYLREIEEKMPGKDEDGLIKDQIDTLSCILENTTGKQFNSKPKTCLLPSKLYFGTQKENIEYRLEKLTYTPFATETSDDDEEESEESLEKLTDNQKHDEKNLAQEIKSAQSNQENLSAKTN